MARLHVWVRGRVQGVFFRDTTQQTAQGLGLAGWVKNLSDGRVEAVFEGDRGACEKALVFVHKGPQGARVDDVEFEWGEESEGLAEYEVRY